MASPTGEQIKMLDPSDIYRPEKIQDKSDWTFRNFVDDTEDPKLKQVKQTYLDMHTHQTVDYVKEKREFWGKYDKFEATILEALDFLNNFVDESDADFDLPNIIHAFQTAENLRKAYPDQDWLHLTGLIHDLGKVMAIYGEPQYSTVGDTFVVGCEFAPSIAFRDSTFHNNKDANNDKFNTKYGMYEPNCGLDNVLMSWGHDEYMYQVLRHNKTTLPDEAMYIIRYHSFYPWHSHEEYYHLCDNRDMEMLKWVKEFSNFDLYTKKEDFPDIESLKPYYQSLIDKYIPGKLKW